ENEDNGEQEQQAEGNQQGVPAAAPQEQEEDPSQEAGEPLDGLGERQGKQASQHGGSSQPAQETIPTEDQRGQADWQKQPHGHADPTRVDQAAGGAHPTVGQAADQDRHVRVQAQGIQQAAVAPIDAHQAECGDGQGEAGDAGDDLPGAPKGSHMISDGIKGHQSGDEAPEARPAGPGVHGDAPANQGHEEKEGDGHFQAGEDGETALGDPAAQAGEGKQTQPEEGPGAAREDHDGDGGEQEEELVVGDPGGEGAGPGIASCELGNANCELRVAILIFPVADNQGC
ncbi:MAG: hypothetical protein P8Y03_26480, partial [Anaerolineales bacterium]